MLARKYLATLIDAAFDTTYQKTNIVRLGKDLEELTMEMGATINTKANILGEQSVVHEGYTRQASVEPLYFEDYEDALSAKLKDISMNLLEGDACKTSFYEVWIKAPSTPGGKPTVDSAWREDCIVEVVSYGGDTTGVQFPINLHPCGNRVKGQFDLETKTFTAEEGL